MSPLPDAPAAPPPDGAGAPSSTAAPTAVPSRPRLVAGIFLGAGLATLGGWILGEYPFTGVMPYIAGVLFALVVTEVILSVSHQPGIVTAVAAALCTLGGLGLAVWISTGRGIDPIPIGGWVALVIGAAVALIRGGITTGSGRAASSPQQP
jgi:hypothetical protein